MIHPKSIFHKFDKIYSCNEYVEMLLSDLGYEVMLKFVNRKTHNTTKIRKLFKTNNKQWQRLVTKAVVAIINRIYCINHLRITSKLNTMSEEF